MDNNQKAFFELLRAGLWGDGNPDIRIDGTTDWQEVYQLAQEQSVPGVVLQGIEELRANGLELKVPQMLLLQWIGEVQIIEQQNKEMNVFIANLVEKLRNENIYTLLVKGQGIAQCYEKTLWRCSGDVDLLLDEDNYKRAKQELIPIAYDVESEDVWKKHLAFKIEGVEIELHGRMPFGISHQADNVVDEVLEDSLRKGGVSRWIVDESNVFMPNPDNHLFIVFTHFLRHFFIEGVGLRQICDWCRLLWTYRDSLNYELMESRIRRAGLMSEWRAFASLAVDYLGMPVDAMPFYDKRFKRKGEKVMKLVFKAGNFGHKKDLSYRLRYSGMTYKVVATWRRLLDFASLIPVFPLDAPKFYVTYVLGKVK